MHTEVIPLYICDVSKSQGQIDWDALAPHLDFAIIKASGLYENQGDPCYAHNVAGAVAHGVPFHAYHYLYCLTEAEAKRDAGLFYRMVAREGHWPLFWVLDCEEGWGIANSRARPVAEAFEAELRRLAREDGAGEVRVAVYIGHNRYKEYALDYSRYAYVWIPRYGSNTGEIADSIVPDFPCHLWQYTSQGHLPGIKGVRRVDLNVLNGDKPLSFFTGSEPPQGGAERPGGAQSTSPEADTGKEDSSMATVYVGGASIDENGKAHGGKAGNQTGRELRKQAWYLHSKGWRVFRAKDARVAALIAQCMAAAVANKHIGYDQYQRNTLYNEAKQYGFDVSKVTKDVECDCSALVRVCCAFAGITGLPSDFRTTNEPANLLKTGAFVELEGSKYQGQSLYLGAGDILCTKTQGHTVVVLNNGSKYEGTVQPREYALGERIIRFGMTGPDVKAMQEQLLALGYSLGKYGTDGDFGECTEVALLAFQTAAKIEADAECGPITLAALAAALDALEDAPAPEGPQVCIEGGDCFIRTDSNTGGRKLGVAKRGDTFLYGGETSLGGWLLIEYKGENAWVSGMYGRLVA